MTDLQLNWGAFDAGPDLILTGNDLQTDGGLTTAILVALFTDARATLDADLPPGTDLRGYWGDAYTDTPLGSLLWLYRRASITPDLEPQLIEVAQAALERGVVAPGLCQSIGLAIARDVQNAPNTLVLQITVVKPTTPVGGNQIQQSVALPGLNVDLIISIANNLDTTRKFPEYQG
ncbi:MAG: phage GP46 family protein [Salinisphaera sp.]|jgi:phage gp46-like protein|nr:phage GP46 family protein [Salinisphaera sp.]